MSFIVSEYWTLIGADEARVLQTEVTTQGDPLAMSVCHQNPTSHH